MRAVDAATAKCGCDGEDDVMPENISELPSAITGHIDNWELAGPVTFDLLPHYQMELIGRETCMLFLSSVYQFQGDKLEVRLKKAFYICEPEDGGNKKGFLGRGLSSDSLTQEMTTIHITLSINHRGRFERGPCRKLLYVGGEVTEIERVNVDTLNEFFISDLRKDIGYTSITDFYWLEPEHPVNIPVIVEENITHTKMRLKTCAKRIPTPKKTLKRRLIVVEDDDDVEIVGHVQAVMGPIAGVRPKIGRRPMKQVSILKFSPRMRTVAMWPKKDFNNQLNQLNHQSRYLSLPQRLCNQTSLHPISPSLHNTPMSMTSSQGIMLVQHL
ncbi:hypothetical protein Ahy_B10g102185 [Arachis hypogaea]|uniref:PB1-like domain-containing protein n=1 Tax=Arachis hypogaea TaxID=3818 RepID=A0A444X1D2_ARAHY|nr:hypothetical protein Ahy_B10g102185 [Arachis hypogaea]